ncbi:MAG: 3-dehydroquinate synthase [Clostridia bacterium]|nr:3-dehydroquinate synthase [Clostridia bacterium]
MSAIKISVTKPEAYDILIENGSLKNCGELIKPVARGKSCLVVTDTNVEPLYLDTVVDSLKSAGFTVNSHVFPAGEESKTFRTVENMLGAFVSAGLTRTDFAVALGGGVTGDLTGFAAAIYQRGIDYIGIPTTLLSQIDSSVGGKTGCDLVYGKNLAGAFHAPKRVIIDPDCLDTLPQKFFSDGLAEAIKYGVIKSKKLFDRLLEEDAHGFINELIEECVSIKRDVTENDFFENGERMLLNFGHTIGHSIEKYYNFKDITHGEAVGIGMVIMAVAAERNGECELGTAKLITQALHKYNLPATTSIDTQKLCEGAFNDKKRRGKDIKLVVPERIGVCTVKTLPCDRLVDYIGGDR